MNESSWIRCKTVEVVDSQGNAKENMVRRDQNGTERRMNKNVARDVILEVHFLKLSNTSTECDDGEILN